MINVFGIRIRFHPLFTLIMVSSVLTGYFFELLTLFGVVLIHELGHVWASYSAGWKINEIKLLPFGGVAEVDPQKNTRASEEIWVALAGPLQNAWMIGLAYLFEQAGIWSTAWSEYFIQANLIIGLFNLLPIPPLDGGKIVQAALSKLLPYYKMIQVSAQSGMIFSVLMILYAAFPRENGMQMNLLFIGVFLLYSNWYEYRHLMYRFIRFLIHRKSDGSQKKGEPIFINEHCSLQDAVKMFYRDRAHWVYVVNSSGRIRAALDEHELIGLFFKRMNQCHK